MVTDMNGVREGYKMTELGEIPQEWEVEKLKNVLKLSSGKYLPSKSVNKGPYPVYGGNGITAYHNEYMFDETILVIGRVGALCGNVTLVNGEVWITDNALFVEEKLKPFNDKYMYYLLQRLNLNSYANKNAQPLISGQIIYSITIGLPTLEEQEKIADILSTVDEAIETTDQLLEKTKELKKGLMQQLLTKGIGHTTFKKTELGEIPEGWEVDYLSNLTEFITKGSTPTTYGFDWKDSGIEFFKSDVVKDGEFVYGDFKYIDKEAHDYMSRSKITAGDLLITITGNIGRVAVVPEEIKEANINQHIAKISVSNNSLNPLFLYYWLNQESIVRYYELIKTGLAYPQISLKQVRETRIPIPSMEEQNKIIEVLSSVDNQLKLYRAEKENLLALKKGLMQKLLTGQLRVTI